MAPSPGDRIGPYEIVAALGAGGMGQVYRAKDTRLGRIVAVKALHESFAGHPERVARFEREAQLLASLNHPNIAAIYGVEESHGATYLVLEFVDGHSLSDMLSGGPMLVRDAMALARQTADALAAAHERGIIHRDFKPGNVMVTAEGQAKVLDFGLGKSLDAEGSSSGPATAASGNSPTMTTAGTQMGMILGTAGYMSPEQAKGRPADRRSDVWAFGCVLYEMLTGKRAFEGEDVSETLAAILRSEPDWTLLPKDLPPALRVLLTRCLVKNRNERLADMSVVKFLLSDTASSLSGEAKAPIENAPRTPSRSLAPFIVATALIAVAATFGITRWLAPAERPASSDGVAHVSIALPDGVEVGGGNVLPVAITRDGTRVAFVGARDGKHRIFVRALGEPEAKALEGTEGGDSPFFSSDGKWLAFFAEGKLRKIAVGGAGLQTLADAPFPRGGDWSSDGYIYFAPTNMTGIWRVPESGGAPSEVTKRDSERGEISHRWPHVVEGAHTLIFGVWTGPGDDEHTVAAQTIGGTERHVLVTGADAPRYAKPGWLLYTRLGDLLAVPWDPSKPDVGGAVPVVSTAHPNDTYGNEGCGNYALSDEGRLVYLEGGQTRNIMRLVWVDRSGVVQPAGVPEHPFENLVISPDGTRAVVQIRGSTTGLWMYEFARNTLTPIGRSAGSSQAPLFTPDGARVIYRGTRKGTRDIYWRAVDGSGDEERLTNTPDVSQTPTSISRDGRWLLYNENNAKDAGGVRSWMLRLDGDHTPHPLFTQSEGENDPQISPDGKWVAFVARVSSRLEIFVAPFPAAAPRRQVSTDGGDEPLWSPDGRELYFQNGTKLMSVAISPGASLSSGIPRVVHEGRFFKTINGNTSYGITPDGSRFLRIQQVTPERPLTQLELVLNWFQEMSPPQGQ